MRGKALANNNNNKKHVYIIFSNTLDAPFVIVYVFYHAPHVTDATAKIAAANRLRMEKTQRKQWCVSARCFFTTSPCSSFPGGMWCFITLFSVRCILFSLSFQLFKKYIFFTNKCLKIHHLCFDLDRCYFISLPWYLGSKCSIHLIVSRIFS